MNFNLILNNFDIILKKNYELKKKNNKFFKITIFYQLFLIKMIL